MSLFAGKQYRVEQDLLKKAVAGDSGASQEIIRSLSQSAYSLAWKMLGRREDAEDVVQEAFIRLWRSAANFNGKSALSTYFYAIVSNLSLDRLKAMNKTAFEVFDELENLPAELVHVDFSDTFDSERISEAVRSLSVKQRMAILMWAYQDLTAAEIAKVMGMNKNSVDQLLFRAKLKLKSELEKGGAYADN